MWQLNNLGHEFNDDVQYIEVNSLCNLLCVKAAQEKNCWTAKSNLCLGLLFLVTARISIRLKDLKLCRKGRVRNLMVDPEDTVLYINLRRQVFFNIYLRWQVFFNINLRRQVFFCLERKQAACVPAFGHFGLAQCVQASTTHKAQQCKHFTIFYCRHTLVLLWPQNG